MRTGMRVIFLAVLITLSVGVVASAQEAKVIAEIAASSEKVVKNAPFSADAVSESVQTLADGNRIVRSSTTKLHRNSEGRFRREIKSSSGGLLGTAFSYGSGVTILDPVAGHRYMLDPEMRTARTAVIRVPRPPRVKGDTAQPEPPPAAVVAPVEPVPPAKIVTSEGVTIAGAGVYTTSVAPAAPGIEVLTAAGREKYGSSAEDLGTRNIEGVEATGKRTVTTIPAGAIGNERPIEIVYEKWYSNELQLTVMSRHSDPRFGEQTYRLTNIVRSEPDPSLFTLPSGYKVLGDETTFYTVIDNYKRAVEKEAAEKVKAAKGKQ